MYLKNFAYTLQQIVDTIKEYYQKNNIRLFDENIVYKALTEFLPITENDFNNYTDILYDKYNNSCYLIQRKNFYILQKFDMPENILMSNRINNDVLINRNLSLENFISGKHPQIIKDTYDGRNIYSYDNIYYKSRDTNEISIIIIGKIDKFSKKKILSIILY